MARDMSPVLKRCRALGLEPTFLGIDKKSNRNFARAGKKVSEYGTQ
ncbi:MAG TPA: 30S ribosomal protein S4, partial [Lachnoclostridium phytofermentans]|nr:30S ribosomal protein S4 [Lachnoclostridium phytofermentans]